MGSCGSSESRDDAEPAGRPVQISRPNPDEMLLHIPRPRIGEGGVVLQHQDHDLTRDQIRQALSYVAQYIRSKGRRLTVITVGGVINTVLLQTRNATHDVDFLGTNLSNADRALLDEASRYAESKCSAPIGGSWLNNETELHLSIDVHRLVTEEALQLHQVVWTDEAGSLTVLAAPWSYAFVSKAQRLKTQYQRGYDLYDACVYLRQWKRTHNNERMTRKQVQQYCSRYRRPMLSDAVLRAIDAEYRRRLESAGGLRL